MAGVIVVEAVLSRDGRWALCGECGRELVPLIKQPAPGHRKPYAYVLLWDARWRLVPEREGRPAYMERVARVRRDPSPSGATARYISFGPPDPLALCPCGVLDRMDPRTLNTEAL